MYQIPSPPVPQNVTVFRDRALKRWLRLNDAIWVGLKFPWRKDRLPIPVFLDFPDGSEGKESACKGDLGSIPELGRSPGGGHGKSTPVFLPGEFPWTEEPGGLQSMGSQRVRHDGATKHSTVQSSLTAVLVQEIWTYKGTPGMLAQKGMITWRQEDKAANCKSKREAPGGIPWSWTSSLQKEKVISVNWAFRLWYSVKAALGN